MQPLMCYAMPPLGDCRCRCPQQLVTAAAAAALFHRCRRLVNAVAASYCYSNLLEIQFGNTCTYTRCIAHTENILQQFLSCIVFLLVQGTYIEFRKPIIRGRNDELLFIFEQLRNSGRRSLSSFSGKSSKLTRNSLSLSSPSAWFLKHVPTV